MLENLFAISAQAGLGVLSLSFQYSRLLLLGLLSPSTAISLRRACLFFPVQRFSKFPGGAALRLQSISGEIFYLTYIIVVP